MYICTRNYDLKRGGTFETAKAGTFHSVTAGTSIPLFTEYQQEIADRMGKKQWMEYNEILFSAYSCAIEGNSFTVDDTRILHI